MGTTTTMHMGTTTTRMHQDVKIAEGGLSAFTQLQALRAWAFLSGEGGFAGIGESHIVLKGTTHCGSDHDLSNDIWVKVYSNGDVEYAWTPYEPYKTLGFIVTG